MTLFSLYQTHEAICSQMAATSSSLEIKERWLELADHWRQKANDCEGLTEAAAEPERSQPLPAVLSHEIAGEHDLPVPPTTEPPTTAFKDAMIAPDIPSPPLSPPSQDDAKATEIDADWKRVLADIRGK